MPEAITIDLVEADLDDALGSQRQPVELHLGRPPRSGSGEPAERARADGEAIAPRMVVEGDRENPHLIEDRPSLGGSELGDGPNVAERAGSVVQPEKQRRDTAVLGGADAREHAVG